MKTESTKTKILDISATPTMKSVMSTISAMTEIVTELKNVVKATEEDRKAAKVDRKRRDEKAK